MSVFGPVYSKYYDLLYKDKNYQEEYNYIKNLIMERGYNGKSVLDIGCGTGKHLKYFKDDGYDVAGVDLSENMILEAKKHLNQENDLICSKASDFKFNKKFDLIISLFHVMSYQTSNEEIEKVFFNVKEHLIKDGLFIFDFWYGPGVLTDPPIVKIKRLEDEKFLVTRLTEPVMRYNENIVDINYEIIVEDKLTHFTEKIYEKHEMRYLFLSEIKLISKYLGLSFANSFEWLKFNELSENAWYGLAIFKI